MFMYVKLFFELFYCFYKKRIFNKIFKLEKMNLILFEIWVFGGFLSYFGGGMYFDSYILFFRNILKVKIFIEDLILRYKLWIRVCNVL